jgi:pyruvate dehydrogenase E1 component beta subunit
LVGIDNVKTVALNTFFDPAIIYESIFQEEHPVLVIENKTDYGKRVLPNKHSNFKYERNGDAYPVVRVRPAVSTPTLTIVAYGGMADELLSMLEAIFMETDLKPELIVPSLISRLPIDIVVQSAMETGKLLVIEEGTGYAGIGSELLASLAERVTVNIKMKRISAYPVPIPAVKSLEHAVLPDKHRIIKEIKETFC